MKGPRTVLDPADRQLGVDIVLEDAVRIAVLLEHILCPILLPIVDAERELAAELDVAAAGSPQIDPRVLEAPEELLDVGRR
jgi:hypothetical protein